MEEPRKPISDDALNELFVCGSNLAGAPLPLSGMAGAVAGGAVAAEMLLAALRGIPIIKERLWERPTTAEEIAAMEQELAKGIEMIALRERRAVEAREAEDRRIAEERARAAWIAAEARDAAERARRRAEIIAAKASADVEGDVEKFGWM